jgi:hypothetical protein
LLFIRTGGAAAETLTPVAVPIADIIHESRSDFAAGEALGVSLPRQGSGSGLQATAEGGSFTSAVLETDFLASHVGLHWIASGAPSFELRSSLDGARWSRWHPVLIEAGKDDTTRAEIFGALIGARQGIRHIQYRVAFPPATPPAELLRLTLTYLDAQPRRPVLDSSAPLPPSPAPPTTQDLTPSLASLLAGPFDLRAQVVTREVWQADESLRFAEDGSEVWPRAYVPPKKVVVHHTAGSNDYTDGAAEVRAVYSYHAKTLGWGDIGYQFLIDTSGQVYEGRRGRDDDPEGRFPRDVASWGVVAGHATSFNYGTSSIALIGNFQELPLPSVMRARLEEALVFECSRSGVDPLEVSDHLMQNDLWRDALIGVPGHRDCTPTECPGDHVYRQLPDIRRAVAARLGLSDRPRVGDLRLDQGRNPWPGPLTFAWPATPGLRFSTLLEGWRRIPGRDEIVELAGYRGEGRPDAWSDWGPANSAAFQIAPGDHGHYTLHVRALLPNGLEVAAWSRATALVEPQVPVDDADAGTAPEGDWAWTDQPRQFYGSSYAYAPPGASVRRFRWRLTVPRTGRYAVQATWPSLPDFSSAAPFTILLDGRPVADRPVDQTAAAATWQTLAEIDLAAAGACDVVLTSTPDATVAADAVRLLLIG